MQVFFTKRAESNYLSIKNYINTKWGENAAQDFKEKVKDFLDLLEKFPKIGIIEVKEKQIRGFQLTKQTRLFYRIKENKIILLALFDVRKDPKKIPS